MIGHDGGIEGFNTSLAYYPDDKLTVVVLAKLLVNAEGFYVEDISLADVVDVLADKLAAVAWLTARTLSWRVRERNSSSGPDSRHLRWHV